MLFLVFAALVALSPLEATSQKEGSKLYCGSAFGAISGSCGRTDSCTAAAFEPVIRYWLLLTTASDCRRVLISSHLLSFVPVHVCWRPTQETKWYPQSRKHIAMPSYRSCYSREPTAISYISALQIKFAQQWTEKTLCFPMRRDMIWRYFADLPDLMNLLNYDN